MDNAGAATQSNEHLETQALTKHATAETADAVVIGAGFGGLSAALALAERGLRVIVLEEQRYPGGCASSFERGGVTYEAGATLFSGLSEQGLFGTWRTRHNLDVEFVFPDPAIELRTPALHLPIYRNKKRFIDSLCALPDAPETAIRRFFRDQTNVADALWPILNDPDCLPPLDARALAWHVGRLPAYLRTLRYIGRPAIRLLERHNLDQWEPLRTWVDANSQITVQANSADAEGLFSLSALDYLFRDTGHVVGGIGQLAWALTRAIEGLGGEVRFNEGVRAVETRSGVHSIRTRKHRFDAPRVFANVLPGALQSMLDTPVRHLEQRQQQIAKGWTACMLYLQLDATANLPKQPFHLQLIADPNLPLTEGNHLFVSVTGAEEDRGVRGVRTATISTHVQPSQPADPTGEQVAQVQQRMLATLEHLAPEIHAATQHRMVASARTWQRFTGRTGGFVGGIPRTTGLRHYLNILPRPVVPGLWMVGDSIFPGQSTLAAALGGAATARAAIDQVDRW